MREKELYLFYENHNRTLLPSLPKHKNKEKRQKIVQKAKLFMQRLRTSVYRRPCTAYKGCHSKLYKRIEKMCVRGVGIRDTAEIEEISTDKVLSVLSKLEHVITPKQSFCRTLPIFI